MNNDNLNKEENTFKDSKDPGTCKHDWDYKIKNINNGNYFTENCKKCLMNINTLEIFKE